MDEEGKQQTTEVRETDTQTGQTNVRRQTVTEASHASGGVVARRVVYYVAGVISTLLALRLVLLLLAANRDNGFVDFIYGISGFFAAPFFGIFNYEPVYGQSVFEVSTIVAIIVYILLGVGIGKLFTLTASRRDV
jgi:hypothetical protein